MLPSPLHRSNRPWQRCWRSLSCAWIKPSQNLLIVAGCLIMWITGMTLMHQNMFEYDHPSRSSTQLRATDLTRPDARSDVNKPIAEASTPDPIVASPLPRPLAATPLLPALPPASPLPLPPPPVAASTLGASNADGRPQVLDASGRPMAGFDEWLKTDLAAMQSAQSASSAAVPSPAWIDKYIAALSVESSLSEQIEHKRAAWSLVGDRYLHFGAGKRFMLHLGVISFIPDWAARIRSHELSPSSEWVLWADIGMGVCALGFELVVVNSVDQMSAVVHPLLTPSDFRWILTDYDGLGQLETSGYFPFAFQDAALATRDVSYSHHC